MNYFIGGFLVGVLVCGVAARSYLKQVVAEEVGKVKAEHDAFLKYVDTRLKGIQDRLTGK